MKPLRPQYELFAQALARGESATKAYVTAGFKPHGGNAGRLSKRESIRARVAEIQRAAETETMLTIQEKRNYLARVVRANLFSVPDDSDLWQEVVYSDGSIKKKMPDKLRAITLDNELSGQFGPGSEKVSVVVRIGGDDGDT